MYAGIRGRDPVYMLTGLKVTKGLALELEHSSSMSAETEASAPLTKEVFAGADTGVAKTSAPPCAQTHRVLTFPVACWTSHLPNSLTTSITITKKLIHGISEHIDDRT
jgi:hypothetical protein